MTEAQIRNALRGKTVYAFGDSIIYGHTAPEKSALRLLADEYGMKLSMFAKNGATVLPGDNDILTQLDRAPAAPPDFIVFDGYTNDAYGSVRKFDSNTFSKAFKKTLQELRRRWPESRLLYVTVHKSGARDFQMQEQLRGLDIDLCAKWNVDVADLFADSLLDTRKPEEMQMYIIDGEGSHPNEICCQKYYVPLISKRLATLAENPICEERL